MTDRLNGPFAHNNGMEHHCRLLRLCYVHIPALRRNRKSPIGREQEGSDHRPLPYLQQQTAHMICNHSKHLIKIALLGIVLGLLPFSASVAGLFKWTDENGKIHYGDRPPPTNTTYGHDVLSNKGHKVRSIDRQLTASERIAASRVTQEMALKLRNERELARIDRLLSSSFPNFKSLDTARDDRIATLDDSIAYLQSRRDGLMEKREINTGRIQHFRRKKLKVPEKLTNEADSLGTALTQLDAQIADITGDREKVVQEFKRYTERLRELLSQQ